MITVDTQTNMTITVEVDMLTLQNSRQVLTSLNAEAQKNHKDIVINMEKVNIVDSSGIAMLVEFIKRHSSMKRSISLTRVTPEVMKIFNVVNITKFLNVK